MFGHFREELFAGGHVAATDEDRRPVQVLRTARENGPVDQVAHLFRLDVAVTENLVGPGVDGHDPIEDARLGVGVESRIRILRLSTASLWKAPLPKGRGEPYRTATHFGENGCFAVSFFAKISSIFGSPSMARLIDSFVAS